MHEMSLRCSFHCVLKSLVVVDFLETLVSRCQEQFSQFASANAPVYGVIVLLDSLVAFQVVGRLFSCFVRPPTIRGCQYFTRLFQHALRLAHCALTSWTPTRRPYYDKGVFERKT